jgi:hypothetical protein
MCPLHVIQLVVLLDDRAEPINQPALLVQLSEPVINLMPIIAKEITANRAFESVIYALQYKFGKQETDQYINLIYIPVMKAVRRKAIIDDYHTEYHATTALKMSSSSSRHMVYIDQESLEKHISLDTLCLTPKYRILGTIDGERNGNDALKRLYNEESPKLVQNEDRLVEPESEVEIDGECPELVAFEDRLPLTIDDEIQMKMSWQT